MPEKTREKMSITDRAKQFSPFAAVTGLDAALSAKEKITVPKIELTEYTAEELNRKIHLLSPGTIITIIYYRENEYVKLTGMLSRLDLENRMLQIVNTKISFDDLLEII